MGLSVIGKGIFSKRYAFHASFDLLLTESLEELTEMVVPLFAGVQNKSVEIPEWQDHPYGPDQLTV